LLKARTSLAVPLEWMPSFPFLEKGHSRKENWRLE
jgi:hypothetical protein